MPVWGIAVEPGKGPNNPSWRQSSWTRRNCGGLTRIVRGAPACVPSRNRPLVDNGGARCSIKTRYPARLRGCPADGGNSSEPRCQELLWQQGLPKHKPARVDGHAQLAARDTEMGRRTCKSKWSLPDDTGLRGPPGYEKGVTAETVSELCHKGHLTEAVEALSVLVQTDCCNSRSLLYTVLGKCVARKDLALSRRVHALTVKSGYQSDTFLCNHILRMYASHGRLQDAMDVFTAAVNPDVFMWSSIISAYVKHGKDKEAVQLYRRMRRSSVRPDGHVFVAALQACARGADLETRQQVHGHVLAAGLEHDLYVCSGLVGMYAKCGSLEEARRVFDGLGQKDVVTWTALISGYSQRGMGQEALLLYRDMQEEGIAVPNSVTFVCLLQACASVGTPCLEMGKELHEKVREQGRQADVFVASSLVNMYAKCGSLEDAQRVFDGLGQKDLVTWTSLIAGYSQRGMGEKALHLYRAMQKDGFAVPNHVTFACLLQACACVGTPALEVGKQLHRQIKESGHQADVFICSSLLNMYAKCGSLDDAERLFNGLGKKDVGMWNAIIAGYTHHSMGLKALRLYSVMEEEGIVLPNAVTFVCLLQACASVGRPALPTGKQLHAKSRERGHHADVLVSNSLVNMYAKCGSLEDAQIVFDGLGQKDVVTWTVLIAGYSQQGMGQEALELYSIMQGQGLAVPNPTTFVCLLQACARVGNSALQMGKKLHAEIREQGHESDVFVDSSLVNMYAKCGSLEDARRVFDSGPKDVVTWTALLAGYAQQGLGHEALYLYKAMQVEGTAAPNAVTFVSLLQACASVGNAALEKGRQLHAQIREKGYQADVFVGNSLVTMYAKCGSLEDAQCVFGRLGHKDVVTWNAMIAGYSQQGMGQEALQLYAAMQEEGIVSPDSVTFVCLLQACASVGVPALDKGKQLHTQIREQGHEADVIIANSLVNMYAKCGSLDDARRVFDGLAEKDVVTWTALLAGYSQQGMGQEALDLYSTLQEGGIVVPDSVTFACLLQACACVGTPALDKGKQLHAQIKEGANQADVFVAISLVNMYAKCGSLEDAQRVFDKLEQKDAVTWNTMIAGYSQQGMGQEALRLYSAMQEDNSTVPTAVTFVCLLQACSSVGTAALEIGKQLHTQVREQGLQEDVFVANSLVNMYAKCGSLQDALRVFGGLGEKDVVTWNAMIAGYSQQGKGQEALHLYCAMQESTAVPNSVTYVCLLQACAHVGTLALEKGKELHLQVRESGYQSDVFVANSLVNMYAKCGSLEDAQRVFDGLGQKDVVTWTALIAGYAQQGMSQEALHLYSAMQQEGIAVPNSFTFVCLLHACADAAALHLGRDLHAQIVEQGLQSDVLVAGSLIDMYGKCGSMFDAQQVFEELPERNIVPWNALIAGYSHQGDSEEVFDLFRRMKEGGIRPDGMTFGCVLSVCSHTGLLCKGQEYFEDMSSHNSITPTVEHYTCMVDLLSRAGYLNEALALVSTMPVPPDSAVWHTLLGACRKWRNVEVGRHAFYQAVKLDRKDAAAYLVMSDIYTSAQMWDHAQEMLTRRKRCRAWKQPGQSWWTDMDGLVHSFLVGDKKDAQSRATPKQAFCKPKEEGYVPYLDLSSVDTPDNTNEHVFYRAGSRIGSKQNSPEEPHNHTEKLADLCASTLHEL